MQRSNQPRARQSAPQLAILLATASATATTVGDMRAPCAPGSDDGTASAVCAAPDDRTAAIDSSRRVGTTTAILIVGIAVAAAVIDSATAYNCSPANNRSPASDRASAIGGTAPSCAAAIAAAAPDL